MHDIVNSAAPFVPVVLAAQLPVDGSAAVWVLAGLTLLATAANQILQARERLTNAREQKVTVDPDPGATYRTRDDCNKIAPGLKHQIETVRVESREDDRRLRTELKGEIDKVEQRIDTMHISMNAQFQTISSKLGEISGQIKGNNHEQ